MQGKVRAAQRLHPPVAFPPARLNLEGLGLKRWQRPEPPVAQERHRQALAAQERARWLAGDQRAGEVQQRGPDPLVVNLAARDGEIHAWFLEASRRVPGDRAECIIRAQGQRRLATETAPRDLWADRQQVGAAGGLPVELTRQPDRPPRPVTLRVAVKRVPGNGARRPGGRRPPVEVVAVSATECQPPSAEEPMAWLWLTSLPVADVPSACTVVPWSRCRWEIARLCRVRKPGGRLER